VVTGQKSSARMLAPGSEDHIVVSLSHRNVHNARKELEVIINTLVLGLVVLLAATVTDYANYMGVK
jgi:hypothetical protein